MPRISGAFLYMSYVRYNLLLVCYSYYIYVKILQMKYKQ